MDHVYLSLPGPRVFSDFRLKALEAKIGATQVRAIFVHHLKLNRDLSQDEERTLAQLCSYGDLPNEENSLERDLLAAVTGNGTAQSNAQIYHVTPRPGTISPWSSKATNITHNCGLGKVVVRLERGMCMAVAVAIDKPGTISTSFANQLHDRMTEILQSSPPDLSAMFAEHAPAPATTISIFEEGSTPKEVLQRANGALGLALDDSEIDYLVDHYRLLQRNPTDVELFMFAQVNSEHCRHKQFNADWTSMYLLSIYKNIRPPNGN